MDNLSKPTLENKIQSVKYTLNQIAKEKDIVLIDSSYIHSSHRIAEKIYDCHDELIIDLSELDGEIHFISKCVLDISQNKNIFTISEVVSELESYMNILNCQADYHTKHINSRKYGKKVRSKGRIGRSDRYRSVDEIENISVNVLRTGSNKVYELIRALNDRIIGIKYLNLLDKVRDRARSRNLKKDFSSRYIDYKKETPYKDTDERIVSVACELASEGKYVAVISNDSDLRRILQSCFGGKFLALPEKGRICLYSDFERNGNLATGFDTALLYPSSNTA